MLRDPVGASVGKFQGEVKASFAKEVHWVTGAQQKKSNLMNRTDIF